MNLEVEEKKILMVPWQMTGVRAERDTKEKGGELSRGGAGKVLGSKAGEESGGDPCKLGRWAYLHPFAQTVEVTVIKPLTAGIQAFNNLPALQATRAHSEASQVTMEVVVYRQRIS